MKQKFIAIIAIAALGMSAMAQDMDKCGKQCCEKGKKECAEKCEKAGKCDKAGKMDCKGDMKGCKGDMKPGCDMAPKAMCPFEGLNLSDKQKEQLKKLEADRRAECEKKAADKKAEMKAKKDEQKAKCEEMKAKMEKERKADLEKIKSILTADQYVKFLENFYLNARPEGPQPGMRHGGPGMCDGGKGHGKMPKPFRKPGERKLRPVEMEPQLIEKGEPK